MKNDKYLWVITTNIPGQNTKKEKRWQSIGIVIKESSGMVSVDLFRASTSCLVSVVNMIANIPRETELK